MVSGKLFAGNRGFDPVTIGMEIVAMQCLYYLTLSLCLLVTTSLLGLRPSLGQLFVPSSFELSQKYSFVTLCANGLNIILVVISQAFVIEKANKCLDYTLTVFFVHLCAVIGYNGRFPWMLEWWLYHFVIIFVTTLAGEYTLMRIES